MPSLDPHVLAAWAASSWLHEPGQAAPPSGVAAAERALGRRLPAAFAELCRVHDGGSWLGSNLVVLPLADDELSVADASQTFRSWGWPVPEEVVVFGNDGGGDPFGLWLPTEGGERPVVVMVGQVFEPGCMGVVGDDLNAFLLARTACYLLGEQGTGPALDVLQLPARLRTDDPDDDVFEAINAWASPRIAGVMTDPYTALMDADDVRRFAPHD